MKDDLSLTYQVRCLTLEDSRVVPAAAAKRPDDGRGNHTSGTTTGDRKISSIKRFTSKIVTYLRFQFLVPSARSTDGHHLEWEASSSSAASSSGPLTHHGASDLQLPTLSGHSLEN